MNEKSLLSDFLAKGTNLVGFLIDEKNENLLSQKLFSALCALCENCSSLKNPAFSKIEVAAFRKNASALCDSTNLYLETLCAGGFISPAQCDSMLKSLDTLKKEFNI